MSALPASLSDLLDRQARVLTRSQLLEHGVTKAAVRWNAGRSWRVLLPSVYLTSGGTATPHQRHVAALLWAGPAAVLSGPTAAHLHGITAAEPGGTVHALVPHPRRSRSRGFVAVRRTLLDDTSPVRRGVLTLSSPARSAVDAAFLAHSDQTREAILIEAVQRRLATVDDLAEWVHRLRLRDAARLQGALAAAASGAWSVPEHELLTLVDSSTVLSAVLANPRLQDAAGVRLTTPDAWFDDVAMAVMVHSHRHHSQGQEWDATVSADGDLVAAGVVVVGVTPRQIRHSPDAVLRRVEATYAVAQRRPRPSLRVLPATPQ